MTAESDARETVEGLTAPEQLGMVVAAAYGTALAERDQAVAELRHLLDVFPQTGWAAEMVAYDKARAWLEEYDQCQAVGSPETPEQETTGP